MILLLVLITTGNCMPAAYNLTVLKEETSVNLENVGNIHLYNDQWTILTSVDLQNFYDEITFLKNNLENLKDY